MPSPNIRTGTEDVQILLDQALSSDKGITIRNLTKDRAVALRQRIYWFREFRRKQSRELYPDDRSYWDTCEYDALIVQLRRGDEGYILNIVPSGSLLDGLEVEEI